MKEYKIEVGGGKHRVTLLAAVTAGGIMLVLVGGEKPHLGGVVLSVPRPSLTDPRQTACTTSVLPLIGHKDDEAARPVAEMIAKATGLPVTVAAGLHIDKAEASDIKMLGQNAMDCGIRLLSIIKPL